MQTFTQTFAGATTWQLNVPGSYFVTLQCTSAINVRLYRGGRKLSLGDVSGLLAGLEIGPLPTDDGFDFAFDRVEIDVTAADTVKIGIGNGMARYNRANGTVDVNSFTAAAAAIIQRPEAPSGFFSDTSALTINTPVTIVAPATNINGMILLSASMSSFLAAGVAIQSFITKASAPASVVDGTALLVSQLQSQAAGAIYAGAILPAPAYIPAGQGLYFISCATTAAGPATNDIRACRYKVL